MSWESWRCCIVSTAPEKLLVRGWVESKETYNYLDLQSLRRCVPILCQHKSMSIRRIARGIIPGKWMMAALWNCGASQHNCGFPSKLSGTPIRVDYCKRSLKRTGLCHVFASCMMKYHAVSRCSNFAQFRTYSGSAREVADQKQKRSHRIESLETIKMNKTKKEDFAGDESAVQHDGIIVRLKQSWKLFLCQGQVGPNAWPGGDLFLL